MTPRRRAAPGVRQRRWAITAFWAFRAFIAFVVALPIANAISGTGIGNFAQGDALLFEPGGLLLSEALRVGSNVLQGSLESALFVLFLCSFASLVPLAALMIALDYRELLLPSELFGRALAHWPRFTLFAGLTLFSQALVIIAFAMVHELFRGTLVALLDERSADLCSLSWFCICLLAVLFIGITQDLLRATAVRHGYSLRDGLEAALSVLATRPIAVLVAWLIPTLWSIAVVAGAAILVGRVHIEHGGTARLTLVLLIHQLAAFGLVALRASWLERAIMLVGPKQLEETAAFG